MVAHMQTNRIITPFITQEQIQNRVEALGQELNTLYDSVEELIIICILKGGVMFAADLMKQLTVPCQLEFVRLASYEGQKSTGTVRPVDLSLPSLNHKHVLLVEDIIDTGLTLSFFIDYLKSLHQPASLRLAVLLDKKEARQQHVQVDFVGFEVENKFLVGYGLDENGLYRNLPYIGVVQA